MWGCEAGGFSCDCDCAVPTCGCQRDFSTPQLFVGFCRLTPEAPSRRRPVDDLEAEVCSELDAEKDGDAAARVEAGIPPHVMRRLAVDLRRCCGRRVLHCVGCARKRRDLGPAASASGAAVDDRADAGPSWFREKFFLVLQSLGLAREAADDVVDSTLVVRAEEEALAASGAGRARDAATPLPAVPPPQASCQHVWLGLCDTCIGPT